MLLLMNRRLVYTRYIFYVPRIVFQIKYLKNILFFKINKILRLEQFFFIMLQFQKLQCTTYQ